MKTPSTNNNSVTSTQQNTNTNPMNTTKTSRPRKPARILMGPIALAVTATSLAIVGNASAVNGTFSQQFGPRYYFAPANWTSGIIADGVGATMTLTAPNSNSQNNGIDGVYINRDLTLSNWTPSGGYAWSNVFTSPGKKLTWDTGTAAAATFSPSTSDGYASHNSMDMYLQSNLVYTNFTQRGFQGSATGEGSDLRGTLSGPGKFTLNWHPINWDGLGNVQYKIQGAAPNTYRGGTELNARQKTNSYNDGNIVKDLNRVVLDKNGALGWGNVTMMHPQVAFQITTTGGGTIDRIDDTAALYLISGSVGDTRRFNIVPGLVEYSGVDLATGVNETIAELYINNVAQPAGTYGRTGSTATNQSAALDNYFRSVTGGSVGLGILTVAPVTKLVSAATATWGTASTWDLSEVPTNQKLVTIDTETVTVNAAGAAAREVRMTGGILDINTATSLDTGRFLSVGNGAAVNVNGTGSLTVSGAGIVETLGTGLITVSSTGTLDVGEVSTSGLSVASGANMTVRTSLLVNSSLNMTGSTLTLGASAEVRLRSGTLTDDNAMSVAKLNVEGGALDLTGNNLTVTNTLTLASSPLDMTAAALGNLTATGATVRLEGASSILTVDTAVTPNVLVYDGGAVAGSGSVIPDVKYEVHNQAISTNLAGSITTITALDAMWGVVELTGANTYEGTTTIRSGVLRAADGTGLPTNSLLSFAGGVFEGSGTFGGGTNRVISNTAGHNVSWTGNGGFAARGGNLTVTLDNAGAPINWSAASGFNGAILILGSTTADAAVEVTNAIDLANGGRTIQADDNTLSANDFATLSGAITGGGGSITKTGAGRLVLSGARTYTGTTTVNAGTLILSQGNPTGGSTTINNSTTMLGIGHNDALGAPGNAFNWNGGIISASGAAVTAPQNVNYNNNNTVIGSFDLTFTGTLTSNNNRTLTNNIDATKTFTVGNVNLSNNSTARTLTITGTGDTTITGIIANGSTATTGHLTKNGAGTLTLNGVNTYTGATTISDGMLVIGGAGQMSSVATPGTYAGAIAIAAAKTFKYNSSASSILSGVVGTASTAGIVIKDGAGTLTLSNANVYTGLTTVNLGTLQLGFNNGIRSGNAVTVAPTGASAVLDLAGFNQTIGGAGLTLGGATTSSAASVSGAASTLTLSGGGTAVTYNAANNPLGATISATNITLGTAALPQTFTVGDSSTVTGVGNELTISSTITEFGAGSALVKEGAGSLKLDGAQSYNILTVNDGTANVNGILGTAPGLAVVTVSDTAGGVATKLRFGSVSQTLSSLTIGAGATVIFTSGAASGSLTGDDGGGKAAGFGSPASSFGGGATVPEPGTLGLLLVGALGMLNRRRRA